MFQPVVLNLFSFLAQESATDFFYAFPLDKKISGPNKFLSKIKHYKTCLSIRKDFNYSCAKKRQKVVIVRILSTLRRTYDTPS